MRQDPRANRRSQRHLIAAIVAAIAAVFFAAPTVQAVGTDGDVSAIKDNGRTVKPKIQGRSANTLKRQCVRAGLTKPRIYLPQINFAGIYARQLNITGVRYTPLPDKCKGRFELRSLGMFQAKRPGEKRWRSLRGYLDAIQVSPSAFDEELNSHSELATFHHKRGDSFYIRRGDRARVLILNKVVNARDKTVARRWFAKRAKIYRGKGKPIFE